MSSFLRSSALPTPERSKICREFFSYVKFARQRALCYLRSAESTRAEDDALPCADNRLPKLTLVCAVARVHEGNTDGLGALEDDTRDAGVSSEMEVRLNIHHAVDVGFNQKC